jgi:hypothetical protein
MSENLQTDVGWLRGRRWLVRCGALGGSILAGTSSHQLADKLSLSLSPRAQLAPLLVVGAIYSLRLPIHVGLKYFWPSARSSKPREQTKLNHAFGFEAALAVVWVGGAAGLLRYAPYSWLIFTLCISLYFAVLYTADWISETAQNAGRQLGSDAVRKLRPVAALVARDDRARGRFPLAGIFSFLFAPGRRVNDASLASRFVQWCVLVLYLGILVTAAPTLKSIEVALRIGTTNDVKGALKTVVTGDLQNAADDAAKKSRQEDEKAKGNEEANGTSKGKNKDPAGLPPAPPEKQPESSTDGEYGDHCTTSPGTGADPARRAEMYAAVLGGLGQDGIGGNETGCLTVAIQVAGHPDVWFAVGYCGADVRGLVAVGPQWPAAAVIQEAAQTAATFAASGELLGVSKRYRIGTGDLVVIATTDGLYLLIRPLLSNGRVAVGKRWCDAFSDGNVAYTNVPPALLGLMIELEQFRAREGKDFLWPADDTSATSVGHDFTFHASGSAASVARASCADVSHCTLVYQGSRWQSGVTPSPSLDEVLDVMPPPPPPAKTSASAPSPGQATIPSNAGS